MLIVKVPGLRAPSILMEMGSALSFGLEPWNGYPWNSVPMRARLSKDDGARESEKPVSSLELSSSSITRGVPRLARIRIASRTDALPVSFRPTNKFTRPSSLMRSAWKHRYRSMDKLRTLSPSASTLAPRSVTVCAGSTIASAASLSNDHHITQPVAEQHPQTRWLVNVRTTWAAQWLSQRTGRRSRSREADGWAASSRYSLGTSCEHRWLALSSGSASTRCSESSVSASRLGSRTTLCSSSPRRSE